ATPPAFVINSDTEVAGGTGVFGTGGCRVRLGNGVRLRIRNARLLGAAVSTSRFVVDGGTGSRVEIDSTSISLTGTISIQPGAVLVSPPSTFAAFNNARVSVTNSRLESGDTCQVLVSTNANGGRAEVRGSVMRSGGGFFGASISASFPGSGGQVDV